MTTTKRARSLRFGVAGAAMMSAAPAWACTLCHSNVAEQVRAALFGVDFWSNLGAVAAPIPLLLGAVLFAARRR